jgi:preprotein translocase subunit SecA
LNEELNKINGEVTPNHLVTLFIQMPQGVVTSFDKTTHRQVKQQTRLFAYTYYAGQFIQDLEEQDLIDKITKHLEGARLATTHAIGLHEWSLAQQLNLSELNELTRTNLTNVLEPAVLEQLGDNQLAKLDQEHIPTVITELGRQTITEIYRTLLLQVISRLWVDYLTAMEGLRVSVGLEAYAQRDPLVQYKLKAFQMFSELLTDIRKTIVTNMFQVASRAPSSIIPGSKLEQTVQNQKMQAKTR